MGKHSELTTLRLVVPYGGLVDINLKPGETIIIAFATGDFGGAAVEVALAMGARVIALGRNLDKLKKIAASNDRVDIVKVTGDEQADTKSIQAFGPIDAYFDISPPEAVGSSHFRSCINALGHSGRISLMGGFGSDFTIPMYDLVRKDLQIKGKWMYSKQNVQEVIKMAECGLLKLGQQKVESFALEDWEKGFEAAAEWGGTERAAVIAP